MNYSRGSEWRKWDLHVHTPESMVNFYTGTSQEEKWELFISDLEKLPEEFKVIGINDYLFIDGYEKVLEYKNAGRLKNIDTILPVVEFRIKKFGGNKVFKRVNFHIIFSNQITPEIIKQQFLNQLYGKYKLEPGLDGIKWGGFITPDSLKDLGKAIKNSIPTDKLSEYGSDLIEGFNNINFDEEELVQILNNSTTYLKDNFLTAVGKTEWDAFSWDDGSIAEKKTVINNVDFVFTSAENIDAFNKSKEKLAEQKVNTLLLDCSDAHRYSTSTDKDRIGKCFTWIKSDTTFKGLKQILIEDDRVAVCSTPELLQRVNSNPNKFIEKINVRRIVGSPMHEKWYDNLEIPLNASLVAVIGNKGNGKSALTDVIGLVGNSYNDNYSFLTKQKFRNPRPYNKSAQIEAALTWADTTIDGFVKLDSTIDINKIEKVKYIPQNFLEKLCANEDEQDFEEEIKKIIFSHTPYTDRLGYTNLDELIAYKSEIINKDLGSIKGELDDINQRIILLERKTSESYKNSISQTLTAKESELGKHIEAKPKEVIEPKTDPAIEARNALIKVEIDKLKGEISKNTDELNRLGSRKSVLLIEINELDKSKQALGTLYSSFQSTEVSQKAILEKYGISFETVLSAKFNLKPIEDLLNVKRQEVDEVNLTVNGNPEKIGITSLIETIKKKLISLEEQLDEPFRIYQKYLKEVDEWSKKQSALTGDAQTPGTLEYLKYQIHYIEELLPAELALEYTKRDAIIIRLFSKKSELINLLTESYKPISDFIQQYGHLMRDYQINLSVEFSLDGFIEKYFDHISQGAKGTFIGIDEGNKFLSDLIPQYNLNELQGILDFLASLQDSLSHDKRSDQGNAKRDIEQQLKKGYTIEDLYRFLYSLDYLKPTFRLNLGTKSLAELSPGERGALLLIFYLFLDKDDKPLIIDQPEENLDNQSVYNYLVHFIKEAKKRRQIIIVTHNPNLAVVCDAEQIIHMTIDKADNYTVFYESGSIENPKINKTIVDILEGTKPAFNNRTNKYSLAI